MNEQEQAQRILSVLAGYFWRNRIYKLSVDYQHDMRGYEIEVSGITSVKPADLDEFRSSLQEGCHPELSDYYDQLLGLNGGDSDAYHLLGALIDRAEITYEQQVLRVRIIRNQP